MNKAFVKALIIAAVAIYVAAPDLLTGIAIDDIIAVLVGAAAIRKQNEYQERG